MSPASLTIVIPTHNRAALLRSAIESVLASPLVQSPRAVVVVDAGSTDDTANVVRRYGVRYHYLDAAGPSTARNAGLGLVDTEFVAFLDDDDRWLPGNIEPQLAALRPTPDAAFAYGRSQRIASDRTPIGEPFPPLPLANGRAVEFVFTQELQIGAIVFRRQLIAEAGGFDESLRSCEDTDLLARLADRHPVIGVDHVGLLFRQRVPSAAEAEGRWQEYHDYRRSLRKVGESGGMHWRARVRAELRYRGRTSRYLCADAGATLTRGRRRDALRYLGWALRLSPLHTLLGRATFWRTLRSVLSPSGTSRQPA